MAPTSKAEIQEIRIAVCGAAGSGKTALVARWCHRHFPQHYDPTLDILGNRRAVTISNTSCVLVLIDVLSSWMAKEPLSTGTFGDVDALLLLYDVSNEHTFNEVPEIYRRVMTAVDTSNKGSDSESIPVTIAAGKMDVGYEKVAITQERRLDLAKRLNCHHVECSALDGAGVDKAVEGLAAKVLERRGRARNSDIASKSTT